MLLFHIAKEKNFKERLNKNSYEDFSLKRYGFIHCCIFEQLLDFANDNFKTTNQKLIVLCINANYLKSEVKWEKNKTNGMIFPHIYGSINTEAVIGTVDFLKDDNSNFFISDELYNYSFYEKSCGGIVVHKFYDGYKVLLINFADKTVWGFPKGHVEKGETEIQTAIREIFEETGLHVNIIPKFRESVHFSWKAGSTLEAVYFYATSDTTNVTCQLREVDECLWCDFDKVCSYLTYNCDKLIFKKFLKFFKSHFNKF